MAVVALLPGCSDDSKSSDDKQEVCNDLVNDGPEVHYQVDPVPAPYATGGTIVDGTYELSSLIIHSTTLTAPPDIAKGVFAITGTTLEEVVSIGGHEDRYTSTLNVQNVYVFITDTCPSGAVESPGFTATATDLRLFYSDQSDTLEFGLHKR